MGRFSLDGYRRQWPRIGGLLAMALGGATTLTARKMSRPQLLSALNLGALLVHQYEEDVDPAGSRDSSTTECSRAISPATTPSTGTRLSA